VVIISEHAFALIGHYLSLDPRRIHWGYQTQVRFLGGDYQGALEVAQRAGAHSHFPGWKAAALFHLGFKDQATAEFPRFLQSHVGKMVRRSPARRSRSANGSCTVFRSKIKATGNACATQSKGQAFRRRAQRRLLAG
jgi:hypothetical protein